MLRKIIQYQRLYGGKRTMFRIRDLLWRRLRYVVFVHFPKKRKVKHLNTSKGIHFQAINSREMNYQQWENNLKDISAGYYTLDERKKQWFEFGDIVIVGFIDNQLVWRSRLTQYDWLYNYFPLRHRDEKSLYHTDSYVPPIFRQQGIAFLGKIFAELTAYEMGIQRVWAFVKINNLPSIKLNEKLGALNYGTIQYYSTAGKISVQFIDQKGSIEKLSLVPPSINQQ